MFEQEDNEQEDYYDKTPEPEEPPKPRKEKVPLPRPDDPRYYEAEESEWEHLKPRSRGWRTRLFIIGTVVAVVALWLGFCYVFMPYIDKASAYGYIDNIERHGTFIKTYEGVMLPYKSIKDTTRVYDEDFIFTADNVHVAADIRRLQHTGKPVCLTFRRYHFAMPWRGESRTIVDSVFEIDPTTLLPPDRRPDVL